VSSDDNGDDDDDDDDDDNNNNNNNNVTPAHYNTYLHTLMIKFRNQRCNFQLI